MEFKPLEIEQLKYSLFLKRRFLPIFLATFLGAFNDNLLRSGLVVLIAYAATRGIELPTQPEILVTVCSALLVAPMMFFSSISGPLADKYEKSRLVVLTKIAEVGIMFGAYYGFATQNITLLMGLLFVSGTHTTFYSPVKFSILPDHLQSGELLAGNGFMAAGHYLAILLGLVAGGLLVEMDGNVIGKAAVAIALTGLAASLLIPKSAHSHLEAKVEWNLWKGSLHILEFMKQDRLIFLSTLALSWFLLVSSVYMSQFANYAQGIVHADNEVYILFLTVFSIGIAAGSMVCDTLLKGEISPRLTPIAAAGMSLFTYLMIWLTPAPAHEGLLGVGEFLAAPAHWPVLMSMLMVALCGGIYIVPLYALMQSRSDAKCRSRVMAASNLCDALFMTFAALVSALLLYFGATVTDLFLILATLNLGIVGYAYRATREVT